jgi:predicted dehydrogenase
VLHVSEPERRPVVLCGLGPHARRIHYPLLERYHESHGVEVALLVELEDQRPVVEEYLAERSLRPKRVVYLPEPERKGRRLNHAFRAAAREALAEGLWGILIASEPKSHFVYAQWAIANGLHVLVDKPITAFDLFECDPAEALVLVEEYFELRDAAREAGVKVLVQAQRRAHAGYQTLHAYLADMIEQYGVPITYLDTYHSDGMWNMPDEFLTRENHPYRYGYGKLMHSGYHFLDLFSWLISLNDKIPECAPDTLDLVTRHVTPADALEQINLRVYDSFFGNGAELATLLEDDVAERMRRFGETDVCLVAQLRRDGAVISTGSINLLQTSFTRRAWPKLPRDTYKGNGRVRHERVTIQVGPLLCAQVHSYQSYEAKERRTTEMGTGGYDHFDILFFRNSALLGGSPFEEIRLGDQLERRRSGDGYLGHNELAREEIFLDFLNENDQRAGIGLHELSVKLTAASYYSILAANEGLITWPELSLDAGESDWLADRALAKTA